MHITGRLACLVGGVLLIWACGSSGSSGFQNGKDGGGGTSGAGGGGSGGTGGIHLLPDSGGSGGEAGPCTGIACNVQTCGGGGATTVSGYTYAPIGMLPLYDVQVFIPNAPLTPFAQG